ncbi:UPF0246 protein YaaA [Olavius sp. associated proteobacterium Delta 1]|nr:UPF0246 protein YaaA [Olavius sp. associated proteobacterium Delta 1]
MIIVINSSKTLDFQQIARISKHTIPELVKDADILVKELRKLSTSDFSKLLKTSEKLTKLNVERYANWQTDVKESNAKQAMLAFRGDIYSGMDVDNYNIKDFNFAQKHVRILSGLYGMLRPLDLIQPYRLEMAAKLTTIRGKNMYDFWGTKINEILKKLLKQEKSGTLVNLCSIEYFKAIKSDLLDVKVITPAFKEFRDGSYRFITLYAKKARGMMCNYIIQNHLKEVDDLKSFDVEGYQFNRKISSGKEWVFTRGE